MRQQISVIIPAINEENGLIATLQSVLSGNPIQVIVVDGGSSDRTREIAGAAGATVLQCEPGRARQMNLGARNAGGEALLFLHADTILPDGYGQHLLNILDQQDVVAGAFLLQLDGEGFGYRIIERLANWRSRRLNLPYGDQAIFLRATTFAEIGGFPDLPLMEDFEMMRRLRRRGRILIAPAAVKSSARRWKKLGLLRTTLINQAVIAGYLLGVPPENLARFYRSAGK
ncbi:MAG: TIGR04283 family arsenosugar biosynthesis glycosyltransferase [Acidobacteria bacterium]|nr:TIGR04283 family arsenosugar biosynthesis glycosyltransferase [Acidobacteriota bacterium]MCW5970090.1 TIGR04283 family arsenosugar biosynthesis glycosyltransferase [Blastocatellales bacterium]